MAGVSGVRGVTGMAVAAELTVTTPAGSSVGLHKHFSIHVQYEPGTNCGAPTWI